MKKGYRMRKQRKGAYNPTREQINAAVEQFLKDGGTIEKIEFDASSYGSFMKMRYDTLQALFLD